MKKDLFLKELEKAVRNNWFQSLQLTFTMHNASNEALATWLFYTFTDYTIELQPIGKAIIAKEFLERFNVVVREVVASFDSDHGIKLQSVCVELADGNIYSINEVGYGIVEVVKELGW